jgi:enoyl-CoA hydratase
MSEDFTCLEVQEEGSVLSVTLNRPNSLNALNRQLVDELGRVFSALSTRDDLRVVVLRGAGRAFCAGLDLKEHRDRPGAQTVTDMLAIQRSYRDVVVAMRRCPQPIIGLLQGAVCGGGFALALAADIRIATPTLRMNAAPILIGFTACDMGISYFLPRMVGSSLAAEYMLTGRFIEAQRAYEMGLVSRVIAADQIDTEAQMLIGDMLRTSPLGLRLTKEALGHAVDGQSLEAVIALEDRNQVLCAHDADCREAMTAFAEKRPPIYSIAMPARDNPNNG